MNERDSELVSSQLINAGYVKVDNESEADIVLLNTCSVREISEIKALGKSEHLAKRKRKNPDFKIGILGCIAENLGQNIFARNEKIDFAVGPRNIDNIVEIIEKSYISSEKILKIGDSKEHDSLTKFGRNLDISKCEAFVSIMQGCNMRCTYCIVPKTRGSETYRPMSDIIAEIEFLAQNGIKEITLLGQIVNNYGLKKFPFIDRKSPFVQLLEKINDVNGIERIRYMSPHPNGFREDLILAHKNISKLCPAVHLPIQSGSNKVLREMNRTYTRESALDIISSLRKNVNEISISTDIIVGFPGETDENFQETVSFFDEAQFDMAFIFKYSPRPGTPAAERLDSIQQDVKEERNKILLEKIAKNSLKNHEKIVGQTVKVLVSGPAKKGDYMFSGLTPNRYKVLFHGNDSLIGKTLPIKIDSFATTTLYGTIDE